MRSSLLKVGIALNTLTKDGHSDASVFAEHMALGDLAAVGGRCAVLDGLRAYGAVSGQGAVQ